MQYCPKCKVHIHGKKTCCPLCQGNLTGEPEENVFPVLQKKSMTGVSWLKVCAFLLVIFEISLGTLYYLSGQGRAWIPVVGAGAALGYLDLRIAMYFRNNILKMFTVQCYIGMLTAWTVDRMTGWHAWSVTWMIPLTFIGLGILTIIIAHVMHMHLVDYVIYLATDVFCSMLQLIPLLRGNNPFSPPAVISMALTLVFASGLMIFRSGDLKNAGGKYLNI